MNRLKVLSGSSSLLGCVVGAAAFALAVSGLATGCGGDKSQNTGGAGGASSSGAPNGGGNPTGGGQGGGGGGGTVTACKKNARRSNARRGDRGVAGRLADRQRQPRRRHRHGDASHLRGHRRRSSTRWSSLQGRERAVAGRDRRLRNARLRRAQEGPEGRDDRRPRQRPRRSATRRRSVPSRRASRSRPTTASSTSLTGSTARSPCSTASP